MLSIKNYRDIPEGERDAIIQELFVFGVGPATGKKAAVKRELERSQADKLPQYLLLFRDTSLVGYVFLITEQDEPDNSVFPWWSVHTLDTLPLEETDPVFAYVISLCEQYGCLKLKDRFEKNYYYQKM